MSARWAYLGLLILRGTTSGMTAWGRGGKLGQAPYFRLTGNKDPPPSTGDQEFRVCNYPLREPLQPLLSPYHPRRDRTVPLLNQAGSHPSVRPGSLWREPPPVFLLPPCLRRQVRLLTDGEGWCGDWPPLLPYDFFLPAGKSRKTPLSRKFPLTRRRC